MHNPDGVAEHGQCRLPRILGHNLDVVAEHGQVSLTMYYRSMTASHHIPGEHGCDHIPNFRSGERWPESQKGMQNVMTRPQLRITAAGHGQKCYRSIIVEY